METANQRSTRARWAAGAALVSGPAFLAAFFVYRLGLARALDGEIALRIRDLHSTWLDRLGVVDDTLFRPTATFVAAVVLALFLWRFGPRWAWLAPLAITGAFLAEALVKNGLSQVLHPRAFLDFVSVILGGHYHAPAGFPSGHVTRAMFLAVIAIAFVPRWISVPIALLALTTPLARIYTESHRLTDVVGGALLGIFVAAIAIWAVELLARSDMLRWVRLRWSGARLQAG